MADMTVEMLGMHFRNPVLPAAGPTVWNGEALRRCAEGGAGALVSKTISDVAADVPHPNMAQVAGGFLNTELWSEFPPEQWFDREFAIARETGLPLIVSMGYTAAQIAKIAPRVKPFADAIELSTHYLGDDPTGKPRPTDGQMAVDALMRTYSGQRVRWGQASRCAQGLPVFADACLQIRQDGPRLGRLSGAVLHGVHARPWWGDDRSAHDRTMSDTVTACTVAPIIAQCLDAPSVDPCVLARHLR